MLEARLVDAAVRCAARIVGANLLEEATVATVFRVTNNDVIERILLSTKTRQSNFQHKEPRTVATCPRIVKRKAARKPR